MLFLPTEEKNKILSAIFGSKAAVDLLKFSLKQRHLKKHLPARPLQKTQLLKQNHH